MQLLISTVDYTNDESAALDAQCIKAGDVIAYRLDGMSWGLEEVGNPDWRIITVADMTEFQAAALTASELPDKSQPTKILRLRQMSVDLAALDTLTGGIVKADQLAKQQQMLAVQSDLRAAEASLDQLQAAAIAADQPVLDQPVIDQPVPVQPKPAPDQATIDTAIADVATKDDAAKAFLADNTTDATIAIADFLPLCSLKAPLLPDVSPVDVNPVDIGPSPIIKGGG